MVDGTLLANTEAGKDLIEDVIGQRFDGREYVDAVEQFAHGAMFGFMVKDTSRGRVVLDNRGRPQPLYWVNAHDTQKLKRGMEILARVFFAAGARKILPGDQFLWSPHLELAAYFER